MGDQSHGERVCSFRDLVKRPELQGGYRNALFTVIFVIFISSSQGRQAAEHFGTSTDAEADTVRQLYAADFNSSLQGAETPWALVEFFASWCPACNKFKPQYEKVGRLFNGPDAPYADLIYVAKVDCADQGALCQRFSVPHYPTLLWAKPAVIGRGSRKNAEDKGEGIEVVTVTGYPLKAEGVLAWISSRLETKFTFEEKDWPRRSRGGVAKQRNSLQLRTSSRAEMHDIEEATVLAFEFLFSTMGAELDEHVALASFLKLLSRHHPSERCRQGTSAMLAKVEKLKPEAKNLKQLKAVPVCGASLPTATGTWKACKGSRPTTRGYSCGVWLLFHSLSVRLGPQEGAEFVKDIRSFVEHFFGCAECRAHFLEMTAGDIAAVKTGKDAALWLWRSHNKVNLRLVAEEAEGETGDSLFPKVQWPPAALCPRCRSRTPWSEADVYSFLMQHFTEPRQAPAERKDSKDAASGRDLGKLEGPASVPGGAVLLVALVSLSFCGGAIVWRRQQKRRK